jgi:Flp pilus assembly protein TadD
VDAHFNLACALQELRRIAPAVSQYRRVLDLQPLHPQATSRLAWILATHPDAKMRNAADAVQLAERLQHARSVPKWEALDVLAAAYAETGRFEEAFTLAGKAVELLKSEGNKERAGEINARLEIYRTRQPYRDRAFADAP